MTTTPSKLAITRRIRLLGRAVKRCGCDATTMVGTALRLWCKKSFPALPSSSLPYSQSLATEPDLISFVNILGQLEFLAATYWLSSSYAMLAEGSYRKKLAMYFTPVSLTHGLLNDLAKQGVCYGSESFLDPACGGAAFLVPIALRMRIALLAKGLTEIQILIHIQEHLCGVELDETLCGLSTQFLCMALHEEIQKTGYIPKFQVHQADSLTQLDNFVSKFDVVVCNPPYRKMTTEELVPLRKSYADVIAAQPNIYSLFIALCIRLVREEGYVALVTPTSFLSGQYFNRLRTFINHYSNIKHIGIVNKRDGVFIDVSQETALTVLQRSNNAGQIQKSITVSIVSGSGRYTRLGECHLPSLSAAWPIPRSEDDIFLLKAVARSKFNLSDYGYRVRVGAFVWNRDKRPTFGSLEEVRYAMSDTAIPLLWSRDISAGGTVRFENLSTNKVRSRFVDLGDKLHPAVVRAPSVVVQRVTSTDQQRRLVVAAVSPSLVKDHGGFVGENHVVIVEQVTSKPAITPSLLAGLLSSNAVDRYFRCISGATNVSAFELNQLALPDPNVVMEALERAGTMDAAVNQAWELIPSG